MDRWMQKLYWNNDAFKDSTNFEHIKTHFYWSHITVSSILHFSLALDGLLLIRDPDQPHEGRPFRTCS